MLPKISLIASVAKNDTIGADNRVPWQLDTHEAFFHLLTVNHPIIMGRVTYQNLHYPLPQRHNIVLSHKPPLDRLATWVDSPHKALNIAKYAADNYGVDEILIVGGGQIFKLFMPIAMRIYLTRLAHDVKGDVHFPDIDRKQWALTWEKKHWDPITHYQQRFDRIN